MTEFSASEIELFDGILDMLRRRGPLSSAEVAAALDEDVDVVDDLLYSVDTDEFVLLLDDRWADSLSLLAGRVFTHRVTAPEVRHDVVHDNPDLDPVHYLPRAVRRLVTGEPLDPVFPGTAEPDRREVPDQVRDPAGSTLLPVGTHAERGVVAGDHVALTITSAGVEIHRVEPTGFGDRQPVQQALVDLLLPDRPVSLDTALLTLCADVPDAFRTPVAPVTDLIAAAGLAHEQDLVALAGFDIAEFEDRRRVRRLVEEHDLSEAEAHAVLILIRRPSRRARHDPDELARAVPFLAEPAVAEAVLRSTLLGLDHGDNLLRLVEELSPMAGRQVRPALQWLRAKVYEARGEVLQAEEALRIAERFDPDWPLTLLDLARYAGDRGDAVRGLALLRRADPYEDPELEGLLEHVQPVAGPVVGRNDPCWCGSGRKFKQCHLHRPADLPLSERARWLWNKARRHLQDGMWPYRVDAVLAERTAYAEEDEAFAGGPDDPLVTDVVLFEGGAFAEFLEMRGELLPADERSLAEQWLLIDRSVFEVTTVRRGEGVTLRDLRSGDVHEVRERAGSATLRPGQLMCARVVPAGDTLQILGGIEPVRLRERDELLALLDTGPEADELVAFLTRRFAPPTVVLTDRARRALEAGEPLAAEDPADLAELDESSVREAMAAYMADYERQWLDVTVPALHGLTPRQAAADPTRREDLVQLLAGFPETDDPTQMSAGRLRVALGLA